MTANMPGTRHSQRFFLASSVLILCAVLASACHAVSISATIGFDGAAKSLVWTPVTVQLANTGDRTVDGVLRLAQADQQFSTPLCTARVHLPPNSKKVYHVYARLHEYGDVNVALERNGKVIALKNIHPNLTANEDILVVSVGSRTSRLNFLSGEKTPKSTIYIGSLPSDALFDRPAAYDGVDVMVVSDLSPASTNPKALEALSMWVASGGTLVVSTRANYRSYQNSFYDEMLPVTITGVSTLSSPAFLSRLGKSTPPTGTMAIVQSSPKPGVCSAVDFESGIPIYAERGYGAGRVVFLAFDYRSSPFRDWNGQIEFWKSIVQTSGQAPLVQSIGASVLEEQNSYQGYPGPGMQNVQTLAQIVEHDSAIKTPSFNTIGIFLVAYLIVLVPINYFILARKRRLELAWVSTPIIVLLFTVSAYGIGYTMKGGKLLLNAVTFIEASSNARYAGAISCASLFSPARRSYDVEIADQFSVSQSIVEVLTGSERERQPTSYLGEKSVMEDVEMAMWASRTFEVISGVDLGGHMVPDLVLDGTRLKGTIRNNTEVDLEDCTIILGATSYQIGRLEEGKTARIEIGQSKPPATASAVNDPDLQQRLKEFALRKAGSANTPILLGRPSRKSRIFNLPDNRYDLRSADYCTFRLDYRLGNTISLPPNLIPGRIGKFDNACSEQDSHVGPAVGPAGAASTSMCLNSGGYFIAVFRLPAPANCEITSMTIQEHSRYPYDPPSSMYGPSPTSSPGFKTRVFNNETRAWDLVTAGAVIKDAGKYIDAHKEVRIKTILVKGQEGVNTISISAEGRRK